MCNIVFVSIYCIYNCLYCVILTKVKPISQGPDWLLFQFTQPILLLLLPDFVVFNETENLIHLEFHLTVQWYSPLMRNKVFFKRLVTPQGSVFTIYSVCFLLIWTLSKTILIYRSLPILL